MKKLTKNQLEKAISTIVSTHCSGMQFDIWDLGKLTKAGKDAYDAGEDITEAILKVANEIKKE